jgi:hypothetical protein
MFEQTSVMFLSLACLCTGFVLGTLSGIASALVLLFIKDKD